MTEAEPGHRALLVCDDVHRSFYGVHALEGADLEVREGTIAGLIGPNGDRQDEALNPTFWSGHVLRQQKPYLGRSCDDIRAVVLDHELIRSLGCESVLNLPVVLEGRTLGTIDLLPEAGWYEEAHIRAGSVFAALAIPGLGMLQRTVRA